MNENTLTTEFTYLSQQPGVQLIKSGTYQKKELNSLLNSPNLKSQIIDVPVTNQQNSLQLGYFSMQPGESFTFTYTFLELKVIINGKIVIVDDQGEEFVAEKGDVLIFSPDTTVIFDKESDGEAIYSAHRLPEPNFM